MTEIAKAPEALEKMQALKASSLFADTSEELLLEIGQLLEWVEFRAGEVIVQKGEHGDSMYLIASGHVRVHDEGRTLDELAPSDVFGEMAALDPEPRSATITARDDVRLLRLASVQLYTLLSARPEIAQAILKTLARRLRARLRDMREDYEYIQQVERVTAVAAAVEAGLYEPENLDGVAQRNDPLGQLARVFRRMVHEVRTREENLKRQVHELRIEIDQSKQAQKVAEITESDYFKSLNTQADSLRRIIHGDDEETT